ncbi:hypothetical protein [Paenarthrobacter sp. NPDC090522]
MILTGTVTTAEDAHDHISAEGATYEEAREKLFALVGGDRKLIVIRTDNY